MLPEGNLDLLVRAHFNKVKKEENNINPKESFGLDFFIPGEEESEPPIVSLLDSMIKKAILILQFF